MNLWQNKNVLITGCSGIIGSWLTRRLVDEGANVVGIVRDRLGYGNLLQEQTINRMVVAHGDITDFLFMSRVMAEYEIDTVFHLAAQTIVTIANRSPLSTFESNLRGTWIVLEACRLSPTVERVVVASSDKAYGDSKELPYREDQPLRGKHPYDVSKSCTDLLAQSYYHTYRLPVAITRLANVYGGGDLNFNRIIPGTIKAVLEGRPPVLRSDGSPLREYLYVEDAVDAYLTLAKNLHRSNVMGEAFNFAPQQPYQVLEIVQEIIRIAGKEFVPEIRKHMNGEILHQYSDSSKAKERLNWHTRWDLTKGLSVTIEWYRKFLMDRRPVKYTME
ncbi:NAD-dependent epimerase/dehydratase [Desulforamulus reducens MI-1]|uniref:NAD-dependent epimerase/dehydratase n=1 Tax=Desulforamulus reducens (strain ATCC BAA-1160 / DSM 100696 / MI-1) TaxID=349161 RepID=A4J5R4_DESRM|nr:GDP-mannose 4,6-dehydratase [Desulforamulus reducens]ABO50417.1 NAD-dependent epimerase/dehydratase [Desulforamulus reducens MI-1]